MKRLSKDEILGGSFDERFKKVRRKRLSAGILLRPVGRQTVSEDVDRGSSPAPENWTSHYDTYGKCIIKETVRDNKTSHHDLKN